MKTPAKLLGFAVVICALPLMAGCAGTGAQDSMAQQSAQSEPVGAAAPATDAPAQQQDARAQSQDEGGESVAGDLWEAITFPFRAVADVVGIIL
ncbi:MAG: hypothetical protein ACREQR_07655 [Candidatus Binataceae bacterium]